MSRLVVDITYLCSFLLLAHTARVAANTRGDADLEEQQRMEVLLKVGGSWGVGILLLVPLAAMLAASKCYKCVSCQSRTVCATKSGQFYQATVSAFLN